jgi:hypothetical protein
MTAGSRAGAAARALDPPASATFGGGRERRGEGNGALLRPRSGT